MDWRQYSCPSSSCAAESWMVQQCDGNSELWSVARSVDERPYTIAATAPICPRCGATLALMEHHVEEASGGVSETGRVFDFVRSLAWAESNKELARGLPVQLEDPYTTPR